MDIARRVRVRIGDPIREGFSEGIMDAIDFILDPVRTGRTEVDELDRVEKAFVGLKVEHFVRDFLGARPGKRDLDLDGISIDIKNTIRKSRTWMIPKETYAESEPVLLIASDVNARTSSMGVMLARPEYLNKPNQDLKRSVKSEARSAILWIAEEVPWPESRWNGLDMDCFRRLRATSSTSGATRAAEFFRRHLGRPIHRSVVTALLHEQYDPMKRLRGNGGARDQLGREGIALLSHWYDRKLLASLGCPVDADHFLALRPANAEQRALLRSKGKLV
jgi:hypothetical protein